LTGQLVHFLQSEPPVQRRARPSALGPPFRGSDLPLFNNYGLIRALSRAETGSGASFSETGILRLGGRLCLPAEKISAGWLNVFSIS
ncbi:MAG: hypothetical protein M1274_02885, partial [Actinobacteria bacterium]|nr:hypothetical protein [Actinomycetota bacterium]